MLQLNIKISNNLLIPSDALYYGVSEIIDWLKALVSVVPRPRPKPRH